MNIVQDTGSRCLFEVEIDQDTGAVALVRYYAVEDVGHMINPKAF